MSNVIDAHYAVAEGRAEDSGRSGRLAGVVSFAAVAFTLALIAVFVTAALRNAPSSAADSDVGAMYGP